MYSSSFTYRFSLGFCLYVCMYVFISFCHQPFSSASPKCFNPISPPRVVLDTHGTHCVTFRRKRVNEFCPVIYVCLLVASLPLQQFASTVIGVVVVVVVVVLVVVVVVVVKVVVVVVVAVAVVVVLVLLLLLPLLLPLLLVPLLLLLLLLR